MAPIYTNNTNHTNDTDDTHDTDNPTTKWSETSPSSFFLRNKNSLQTIKPRRGHDAAWFGHAFPTFPDHHSPATAARSTRSQLPILPTPLPAPLVPRSPFPQHRYPLRSFPAPHSPNTATRCTGSPLLIPPIRNANITPMRHHFAPAKPIAVFWTVLQNDLNLRAKTMNGMRKQHENGTRLLHGRAKVGETKANHSCGQREAF